MHSFVRMVFWGNWVGEAGLPVRHPQKQTPGRKVHPGVQNNDRF